MLHYVCLVTQSCLTLSNPMKHSPPGSSVHGDFPGKNTVVGCHALLQGIVPTQGSNPFLQHCRKILTNWATRKAHITLEMSSIANVGFYREINVQDAYILYVYFICVHIYIRKTNKILNTELSENNTFIF